MFGVFILGDKIKDKLFPVSTYQCKVLVLSECTPLTYTSLLC